MEIKKSKEVHEQWSFTPVLRMFRTRLDDAGFHLAYPNSAKIQTSLSTKTPSGPIFLIPGPTIDWNAWQPDLKGFGRMLRQTLSARSHGAEVPTQVA